MASLRRELDALGIEFVSFCHRPVFRWPHILHCVVALAFQANLYQGEVRSRPDKGTDRTRLPLSAGGLRPRSHILVVGGAPAERHDNREEEDLCNSHITTSVLSGARPRAIKCEQTCEPG